MRYFLISYDQTAGALLVLEEYPDEAREAALQRRFDLEDHNRDDPNVEVVLLGAESRESLEATHGRYFKRVDQLAREG